MRARYSLLAALLLSSLILQACSSPDPTPAPRDESLDELSIVTMAGILETKFDSHGMPFRLRGMEFPIDGGDQVLFVALRVPNDWDWLDWVDGMDGDPDTRSLETLLAPLRRLDETFDIALIGRSGFDRLVVDYDDMLSTSIEVPFIEFERWASQVTSDETFFSSLNIYGGGRKGSLGEPPERG